MVAYRRWTIAQALFERQGSEGSQGAPARHSRLALCGNRDRLRVWTVEPRRERDAHLPGDDLQDPIRSTIGGWVSHIDFERSSKLLMGLTM